MGVGAGVGVCGGKAGPWVCRKKAPVELPGVKGIIMQTKGK